MTYEVANTSYEVATGSYEVVKVSYEVAETDYEVAKPSYEVAKMTYEVVKPSYEVATSTYRFETGCNLTRTLITQAETPILTSVSTFCFFNNSYFQGQKNKKSFHFLLPTAGKRNFI